MNASINNGIRRKWYVDEWWYPVIDIVKTLNNEVNMLRYLPELKAELAKEGFEVTNVIMDMGLTDSEGKPEITDCITMRNVFRIIQSIHSKNAEPFKMWLAKIGVETLQEMDDPELIIARMHDAEKSRKKSR